MIGILLQVQGGNQNSRDRTLLNAPPKSVSMIIQLGSLCLVCLAILSCTAVVLQMRQQNEQSRTVQAIAAIQRAAVLV